MVVFAPLLMASAVTVGTGSLSVMVSLATGGLEQGGVANLEVHGLVPLLPVSEKLGALP